MIRPQLTLIQDGEFIVCEEVAYTPPPARIATEPAAANHGASLTATAVTLPINTMKATSVRIGDEIIPLPFIRSQARKAVSHKIIIDGPISTRIAKSLGLV
jgi:hypothetical protein